MSSLSSRTISCSMRFSRWSFAPLRTGKLIIPYWCSSVKAPELRSGRYGELRSHATFFRRASLARYIFSASCARTLHFQRVSFRTGSPAATRAPFGRSLAITPTCALPPLALDRRIPRGHRRVATQPPPIARPVRHPPAARPPKDALLRPPTAPCSRERRRDRRAVQSHSDGARFPGVRRALRVHHFPVRGTAAP